MASVQKIDGSKGVSFKLIAFCGYTADGKKLRKTKTWKPPAGMTETKAEKEAEKQAVLFENAINTGSAAYSGTTKFSEYAEKWLDNAQIAPKTKGTYIYLLRRINPAIGHLPLSKLQAHHLESFYKNLREEGIKEKGAFAAALPSIKKHMEELSCEALALKAGISAATVRTARDGKRINVKSAEKISAALNVPVKQIFDINEKTGKLSDKTLLHYHRLISTILNKAKRERLIPFNVAAEHTDAPKVKRKEAAYLSDTQAQNLVCLLLEEEDIRKKTVFFLFLYSGLRRGELCGLQWEDIDDTRGIIHICRASQYQSGKGIITVPVKNDSSERVVDLPPFIFDLLADYRRWWIQQQLINGSKWQGQLNRLFIQADISPYVERLA
jgi:integrase